LTIELITILKFINVGVLFYAYMEVSSSFSTLEAFSTHVARIWKSKVTKALLVYIIVFTFFIPYGIIILWVLLLPTASRYLAYIVMADVYNKL
jgi:hypothetical protein